MAPRIELLPGTIEPPIFKLPAEVLNQIWELALARPDPIELYCNDDSSWERRSYTRDLPINITALSQTCWYLRQHTSSMFFAVNTFILHPRLPEQIPVDLHAFCVGVGKANFIALKQVTVDLGHFRGIPRSRFIHAAEVWRRLALGSRFRFRYCLDLNPSPGELVTRGYWPRILDRIRNHVPWIFEICLQEDDDILDKVVEGLLEEQTKWTAESAESQALEWTASQLNRRGRS